MTFFDIFTAHFSVSQYLELILRIVVAAVCGAIVGTERTRRLKDAGVRTHCMVACTAALFMIISKYGFADLTDLSGASFSGIRGADPARIAAQVVSGVSFLGAGIIYKDKDFNTKGLTTAAGIWAVAGVGMAMGAGFYVIGLFATVFVLALQMFMHKVFIGAGHILIARMEVVIADSDEAVDLLHDQLDKWHIEVRQSNISRLDSGKLQYNLHVTMRSEKPAQETGNFIAENPTVYSVRFSEIIHP